MTRKRLKENSAGKGAEASSGQLKESKPLPKHQKNWRGGNRGRRNSNANVSTTPDSDRSETTTSPEVPAPPEAISSEGSASNAAPCPPGPLCTSSRIRSASECTMVVTPCPPDVLKAKEANISADNDPILRSRNIVNYFEPPKQTIRPDTSDGRMPARDVLESTSSSKARRSLPSKADADKNWRKSSTPHRYAPMSVKDLLTSVEEIDSPVKENDHRIEFTGGAKLQLKDTGSCLDVPFEDADLADETKRELTWMMDGLIQMISPVKRQMEKLMTLDDSYENVVDFLQSVEDSNKKAVMAKMEPAVIKETVLWMRRLFFVQCCSTGFVAHDFIDDKVPFFEKISKLDIEKELELILAFAERLSRSEIICDGKELLGTVEQIKKLLDLVKMEDVQELAKNNIVYSLSDPVDRLRFDKPISEDEFYKIVDSSVTTDCGKYLWIVDRCPEKLMGSARIVSSIVKGISVKRVSKDQRPARAYYVLMPQLVGSLTEEERHSLAKEHADNRERKVENWPEMMYEGYLMSLTNIHQKPKDNTDIVLLKLLEVDTVEDMKNFLFACALIAEFNPDLCPRIYNFSKDSFCTRMARVFMSTQISPAKRTLLLEALMSLPEPFKDRLLAKEGFNPEHSLYHTVKAICTEMPKVPNADIRKWGSLVVRELATVLSPARMISFAILPCLTSVTMRLKAAILLPELLASEKLTEELLQENGELSPAHLVKMALEQYEEPQGDAPKPRYGFIEGILKMIDGVLEGDVPQRMIDEIDTVFGNKGLTWQQHYALLHINFPKSNGKLKAPKIPPVDFTLDGLANFNSTALLQTWPNKEDVRSAFEKAVSDLFANEDKVMIAYVLLSAATETNSKIKDHFDFLKEFAEKIQEAAEESGENEREVEPVAQESSKEEDTKEDDVGTGNCVGEKNEVAEASPDGKTETEEKRGDEKTEQNSDGIQSNNERAEDVLADLTKEDSAEDEGGDPSTWLTQRLLEASDVNPDLRRAVLRIAVGSAKYTREATRIQLALSVAKNSPKKNNKPAETPAVWNEEEAKTTTLPEKTDEKPSLVDELPDDAQTVVPAVVEIVLPPETPARPVTPASSCASVVCSTQFTPVSPPAIIFEVDKTGTKCPPIYQKEVFSRWIVIFDEQVASVCGDFVGFLKGPCLKGRMPSSIRLSVGGRRPVNDVNRGRAPLPNPGSPLYLEITCHAQNREMLLEQAFSSLNIAFCDYVSRFYGTRTDFNRREGQQGGQRSGDEQQKHREEDANRRHGDVSWQHNRDRAAFKQMLALNGLSFDVYNEKLGNNERFQELRKKLGCGMRTVNRFSRSQVEPPTLEIWSNDAEIVKNAIDHIKKLFGIT